MSEISLPRTVRGLESVARGVAVTFDDGSRLVCDAVDAHRLGIAPGACLDEMDFRDLAESAARHGGRWTAGRLLARRPASEADLRRAIGTRHGVGVAAAVVGDLDALGLIDDRAYAQRVAEHRLAQGHGPARIRHDLDLAGVDQAIIAAVVEAIDPVALHDAARRAARGLEGMRAAGRLARRGFDDEDLVRSIAGVDY